MFLCKKIISIIYKFCCCCTKHHNQKDKTTEKDDEEKVPLIKNNGHFDDIEFIKRANGHLFAVDAKF